MAEKKKYHVNEKGQAGPCKATKRPCRFGGDSGQENHYPDLKSAQVAAEKRQEELAGGTFKKMQKAMPLPERTPERVQAWAALDAARIRRDKLVDALQRSKWREEGIVKAEKILAIANDTTNDEGTRRAYYNEALKALKMYSGASSGNYDPYPYGSGEYTTPKSVQDAVDGQRQVFNENVTAWKKDLELHEGWIKDQEAALKQETGLTSDPLYGVPSGEGDVKEFYKNKAVGNYSMKPKRSVEMLKDAARFCTRCNQPIAYKENYGWRHASTGEYRCEGASSTTMVDTLSANPVCSYCGTGNPKHSKYAQEAYADTSTCERCGGVSGYALGD